MGEFVIEVSRSFSASAAELFDLLTDDERFFTLRPDAREHRDIELLPTGGHNCTQVYDMRGGSIVQRCTNIEFVPPSLMRDLAEGDGYRHEITTSVEDLGATARLTVRQHTEFTASLPRVRRYFARRNAAVSLRGFMNRVDAMLGDA